MKLTELAATFIKYEERSPHEAALRMNPEAKVAHWVVPVATVDEAHGVQLKCPKACTELGPDHAHLLRLWFFGASVPREIAAGSRYRMVGGGRALDSLSLSPATKPEEDLCGWAGMILNGETKELPKEEKVNGG